MKRRSDNLAVISIFQIILLVNFTIALSFILSSSFVLAGVVPRSQADCQEGETFYPANEVKGISAACLKDQVGPPLKASPGDALASSLVLPTFSKPIKDKTQAQLDRYLNLGLTPPPLDSSKKGVEEAIAKIGGEVAIKAKEYTGIENFASRFGTTEKALEGANPGVNLGNIIKNGGDINLPENTLCGGKPCDFLGLPGTYGYIAHSITYAAYIYYGIQIVGSTLGLNPKDVNAVSNAATAGYTAAKVSNFIVSKYTDSAAGKWLSGTHWGGLAGSTWLTLGVTAAVFILSYKKEKQETVTFSCLPWQPEKGGKNCGLCDNQKIPCSEYQCRSLGKGCELINPGTNEEKCTWVTEKDVTAPIAVPLESALLDGYAYTPNNVVSPPDRGVKIVYQNSPDGCVPAFTPLRFGVRINEGGGDSGKLPEPAACKIDILRQQNYDLMRIPLSGGLLRYNHTHALSLPSAETLASENITIENGGTFQIYLRCEDANGNSAVPTLQFSYCVDQGPDTTAPLIISTSIIDNSPVSFNQSSVDLGLFVNEPAECRWDHVDRDYETMENQLSCSPGVTDFNAQAAYPCSTTLTGLKDSFDNEFFIRCKDKPSFPENERYANAQSYKLTLRGTKPLVIDSISPDNETIKDSTNSVKVSLDVETSQGSDDGKAICYYSPTGDEGSYIEFFKTNSYTHNQDLHLSEGSYDYFIRCIDLGGNVDNGQISFSVETDLAPPKVVRVYKEENSLKLITDEKATCVYSTFGCSYDLKDGTDFTTINDLNHFISWNPSSSDLYVKCKDDFGNQPDGNKCNIVVRASEY